MPHRSPSPELYPSGQAFPKRCCALILGMNTSEPMARYAQKASLVADSSVMPFLTLPPDIWSELELVFPSAPPSRLGTIEAASSATEDSSLMCMLGCA